MTNEQPGRFCSAEAASARSFPLRPQTIPRVYFALLPCSYSALIAESVRWFWSCSFGRADELISIAEAKPEKPRLLQRPGLLALWAGFQGGVKPQATRAARSNYPSCCTDLC